MFKNKWLVWPIIIVIAIVGFVVWRAANNHLKIKVAKVKMGSIVGVVTATGEIKGESAKLGFKALGRIVSMPNKEGDRVSRGQVLAKLDSYEQAQNDFGRIKGLFDQGFVSKKDFENAKLVYEGSVIISPIDGIITQKSMDEGETASPGLQVFSVVDPKYTWAEIQIDQVDSGEVREGQRVNISVDAYPDKYFPGHLTWLSKEAELKKTSGRVKMDEDTLVFRGKVSLDQQTSELKPGMSIDADIVVQEKGGVLLIPRDALFSKEEKNVVFKKEKDRVRELEVQVGIKDPVNVEIKNSLQEGDEVAITNLEKLKDRTKVKVEQ